MQDYSERTQPNQPLMNQTMIGYGRGLSTGRVGVKLHNTKPQDLSVSQSQEEPYSNFEEKEEIVQSSVFQKLVQSEVNSKGDRSRIAKSVPRVRPGYYDNILKSPLLNFGNYPKSILKRLASRGEGSIRKSQITTAQSMNQQPKSERKIDDMPVLNDHQGFSSNERSQKSLILPSEPKKQASVNRDISSIYESERQQPVVDYVDASMRSKESQRERSSISRGHVQESQYEQDPNPIMEINDFDGENMSDNQINGQQCEGVYDEEVL